MKFVCVCVLYYACSADVSITQNYLISGSDSGSLGCFYFDDSPPLVPRAEKLFPHLCEFVTELLSRRKNSGERSVTNKPGDACATLLFFNMQKFCRKSDASASAVYLSFQSAWQS
jgi:hypothetical protein